MENPDTIKELLNIYYQSLNEKNGWQSVVSDEFTFLGIGGKSTPGNGTKGKNAYIEVINRFYLVFETVKVKEIIVDTEKAYVLANYDLLSPAGDKLNFDIAEIWKVKNRKLDSLILYFDTVTWNNFMKN